MGSLVATNQYLPEAYQVTLEVGTKPNFSGEVSFKLRENRVEAEAFGLTLHAASLVVLGATVDGEKLTFKYDKKAQEILFSNDTKSNLSGKTVVIKFIGIVNSIKTFRDQTKGVFKTNYLDSVSGKSDNIIIATQTQPNFARTVFPVIDDPAFKVPISLTIKTLARYTVLSNSPVESESETDGFRIVKFRATPPMLSSNFAFVVGDLEYIEHNGEVPMRIYTPLGEALKAQFALDTLVTIFPKALECFGRYPLQKLDFAALPFLSDGATENWGLITVMRDHLLLSSDGQKPILQQLIAHELVHQWMGNLVSYDEWKYLWLNESFATLAGNYILKISGVLSEEQFVKEMIDMNTGLLQRSAKLNIQKFMNSLPNSGVLSTAVLFNNDVYEKGIILLRMIANVLSGTVDDYSVFFSKIKEFIAMNRYKSIKPTELWMYLYHDIDFDLLAFINMYLRYDGFPTLNLYEENAKLVVEQINKNQFQIPLHIKTVTGEFKQIMTHKKIELDFTVEDLVALNQNKVGHFKINMSKKLFKRIPVKQFNSLDIHVYSSEFPEELGERLKNLAL